MSTSHTPEQKARYAAIKRKRYQEDSARYRKASRAWKARNITRVRAYDHARYAVPGYGQSLWASASYRASNKRAKERYRLKSAWLKWTRTCAASRSIDSIMSMEQQK